MLKPRSPLATVLAAGLLAVAAMAATALAGCSPEPAPTAQPDTTDRENLIQALTSLGPAAAACAAQPPDHLQDAGLELLARHAPVWLDALGTPSGDPAPAPTSGPASESTGPDIGESTGPETIESGGPDANESPGPATQGDGCDDDLLLRDLTRVRAFAARLGGEDAVAAAIMRAAAADEAIVFAALDGADPPPAEDLARVDSAALSDLALAEDQAGFIGEHLAAQAADPELADQLAAAAALHRSRGQILADLGAEPDPRQTAYQLGEPTTDAGAAQDRWAAVELALASHYAALPAGGAADPMLTWELVAAAAWGAELPALPFID
ncbi:MAG: ferritin-like domain-containing protein [Bifidobacteriaceae bacterium]|jgi:hypothetical protein|nr:ferritin-like domain-containing protein [Bifidobacteriaceae bacterium]